MKFQIVSVFAVFAPDLRIFLSLHIGRDALFTDFS